MIYNKQIVVILSHPVFDIHIACFLYKRSLTKRAIRPGHHKLYFAGNYCQLLPECFSEGIDKFFSHKMPNSRNLLQNSNFTTFIFLKCSVNHNFCEKLRVR